MNGTDNFDRLLGRARAYYGGRWEVLRVHPRQPTRAEEDECGEKLAALYRQHGDDHQAVRRDYNSWCEARGL